MWICGALNCEQYFSLILIARQLLLCDMAFVREYAEANTLTVYVLRRTIADATDVDLGQAAVAIQQCNRLQLWTVLSRGVHMRATFALGMSRVNPLVLAIQANCQEDPDLDYDLPDTVQALLWACCSPDDYGAPEVSPLGEALRAGDDMAVSLLLQHGANPSRREEGCNDPIFLALQANSAENVHRLLQYHANPRSREAVPSAEGSGSGRRVLRRRTALEVAASLPRCRQVILDFIASE